MLTLAGARTEWCRVGSAQSCLQQIEEYGHSDNDGRGKSAGPIEKVHDSRLLHLG